MAKISLTNHSSEGIRPQIASAKYVRNVLKYRSNENQSNEIRISQGPPVTVPAFFHFHKNVLQQQKVHDPPQIDPYFSLPHPP